MTFPVGSPSIGTSVSAALGDSWADGINYLQDVLEGTPTAWTPSWTASVTAPTPGTGSGAGTKGWWSRQGDWMHVAFYLGFGTAGAAAGSGFYQMNLPANLYDQDISPGWAVLFDFSATSFTPALVRPVSTTAVRFGITAGYVTGAVPWAWGIGDNISGHLLYRAA